MSTLNETELVDDKSTEADPALPWTAMVAASPERFSGGFLDAAPEVVRGCGIAGRPTQGTAGLVRSHRGHGRRSLPGRQDGVRRGA